MHTKQCKVCGKAFRKPTHAQVASALSMHCVRKHGVSSTTGKAVKTAHEVKQPPAVDGRQVLAQAVPTKPKRKYTRRAKPITAAAESGEYPVINFCPNCSFPLRLITRAMGVEAALREGQGA